MKKVTFLLALFCGSVFAQPKGDTDTVEYGVVITEQKTIITYAEFEGYPVQFVYDRKWETVNLRVYLGRKISTRLNHDKTLEYLVGEVKRLTSSDKPTSLGVEGATFTFLGKYPIWPPTSSLYQDGEYENLHFAEQASASGLKIKARGRDNIVGYDGYRLWKRR